MIICPNLSNKKIAQEFQELTEALGEAEAYKVWNLNNGYHLDKASNGKDSILFNSLLELTEDRVEALQLKAKTYTPEFKAWFNGGTEIDENGEPTSIVLDYYVTTGENANNKLYGEGSIADKITNDSNAIDIDKVHSFVNNEVVKSIDKKYLYLVNIFNTIYERHKKNPSNTMQMVLESMGSVVRGDFRHDLNRLRINDLQFKKDLSNYVSDSEQSLYFMKIFLHEYAHSLHSPLMFNSNDENLFKEKKEEILKITPKEDAEFIINITELYFDALRNTENKDLYGFTNTAEFVSEAFSNPEFQNELSKHKSNNVNLFDKFLSIVRKWLKSFGVETSNTILESTLATTIEYANRKIDFNGSIYLQSNSNEERTANINLDKALKVFLDKVGIKVYSVDNMTDKYGNQLSVVARAQILEKIIEVANGKAKLDTLPEETAHFFVEFMEDDNPLLVKMMKDITSMDIYRETFEEYKDKYGNFNSKNKWIVDEEKIKKEAIGKAIAKEIVGKFTESEENKSKLRKFIDRILDILRLKFKKADYSIEVTPFVEAAQRILNADTVGVEDVTLVKFNGLNHIEYYQQDPETRAKNEEINRRLENPEINKVRKDYFHKDGTPVADRITNFVKRHYARFNKRAVEEEQKVENKLKANKGIYIHKIGQVLMERIIAWDVNQDKTFAQIDEFVNKQMYRDVRDASAKECIKDEDGFENMLPSDDFFNLGHIKDGVEMDSGSNFKELQNLAAAKYKYFKAQQDAINEKDVDKSVKGKFKLHTERIVYSKEHDRAGTIDLLCIYSNNVADVFDYKSINFATFGDKVVGSVSSLTEQGYNIQMAGYADMLRDEYGIDKIGQVRVIPIRVQLDYKNKKSGFYKIETGYGKMNKPYLDEIPADKELTDSKRINSALKSLFAERDIIRKELEKDYKNQNLKAKYNRINSLIKHLQLRKDYQLIFEDIKDLIDGFNKRSILDSKNKNQITFNDIKDYVDYAKYYRKALEGITDQLDEKDDKLMVSLGITLKKLDDLDSILSNKVVSLTKEMLNLDLTETHNQEKGFSKYTKQLSEFNAQAFQVLQKLVAKNENDVRVRFNKIAKNIKTKSEDLKKWAHAKGWSLQKAYEWLITDSNGTLMLVSKFNGLYREEKKLAVENSNYDWFVNNTNVVLINKKYYYEAGTKDNPGPREKYEAELLKLRETLDKKYGDNKNQQFAKTKELETWLAKYDITDHASTAFSGTNFFIQAKDNPRFHSEKWVEMNKPENKELLAFYNMLIEYNEMFSEMTDRKVENKRFMPNFQRNLIQKLGETGVSEFKLGSLKAITKMFEVVEYDPTFGSMDMETGRPMRSIPLIGVSTITEEANSDEIEAIEKEALAKFGSKTVEYDNYVQSETIKLEKKKGQTHVSTDLARSFTLFAESALSYDAYSASEDLVRSLEYFVHITKNEEVTRRIVGPDGRLIMDESNNPEIQLGYSKDEIEAFTAFVDLYWYGQTMQDQDIHIRVEKFLKSIGTKEGTAEKLGEKTETSVHSVTKFIQGVNNYVGLKALGLSWISGASNAIGMASNLSMASKENRYFNEAFKKYGKLLKDDYNKYLAIREFFEVNTNKKSLEKANKVSSNKLSKFFNLDTAFIFMKEPSERTDDAILVAMMHRFGIVDGKLVMVEDGADNALINLFKYNEQKDEWGIEGLDDWDFADFRQKVMWQATQIKGDIPEQNKLLASTKIWGILLGKFRWWMLGQSKARFKKVYYDQTMKDFGGGRFSIAFAEFSHGGWAQAAKNFIPLMTEFIAMGGNTKLMSEHHKKVAEHFYNKYMTEHPEHKGKLTLEQFVKLREAKLKSAATELRYYLGAKLALYMLGVLMFGAGESDDKKRAASMADDTRIVKFLKRNLYIVTKKAFFELSFFIEPYSTFRSFMIAPAAALSLVIDLEKLLVEGVDESRDYLFGENSPNDQTNFTNRLIPFIPGGRTIENTFDFDDNWKYQQVR